MKSLVFGSSKRIWYKGISLLYLFALHLAHAAEAIVVGAMGGGVHQRGKRRGDAG